MAREACGCSIQWLPISVTMNSWLLQSENGRAPQSHQIVFPSAAAVPSCSLLQTPVRCSTQTYKCYLLPLSQACSPQTLTAQATSSSGMSSPMPAAWPLNKLLDLLNALLQVCQRKVQPCQLFQSNFARQTQLSHQLPHS